MAVNSFSGQPAIPASYGFTAGKNKIINGDFGIWQRGTSFTNPASDTGFTADRWYIVWNGTGATRTITQQAFTPGTAPVAGYEGTYFFRYNQSVAGTGNTYNYITTSLEDVRTFANQVVTLSFWAKASASSSIQNVQIDQNFGSGGSAINYNALSSGVTSFNLTTSWQRFSVTGTLASISGKTIGTGSYLRLFLALPTGVTSTIDVWGVQLEAGSTATSFQTATGTIQGELAACQRYYYANDNNVIWSGNTTSGSNYYGSFYYPVSMRALPTVTPTAFANSNFSGTPSASGVGKTSFTAGLAASGTGSGSYFQFNFTASAEL